MLTEDERTRFRALQARADAGSLTNDEQTEYEGIIRQIEADEAVYLRPATERLRQECVEAEARNDALRQLVHRQERLARRLQRVLEKSRAEQSAIKTELTGIMSGSARR